MRTGEDFRAAGPALDAQAVGQRPLKLPAQPGDESQRRASPGYAQRRAGILSFRARENRPSCIRASAHTLCRDTGLPQSGKGSTPAPTGKPGRNAARLRGTWPAMGLAGIPRIPCCSSGQEGVRLQPPGISPAAQGVGASRPLGERRQVVA